MPCHEMIAERSKGNRTLFTLEAAPNNVFDRSAGSEFLIVLPVPLPAPGQHERYASSAKCVDIPDAALSRARATS